MRYLRMKDYSEKTSAEAYVFMNDKNVSTLPSSWTLEFFVHCNIAISNTTTLPIMNYKLFPTETATNSEDCITISIASTNLSFKVGSTTKTQSNINNKWNHIAITYQSTDSIIIYVNATQLLSVKVSSLSFKNYPKFDKFLFTLHKGDNNICYAGIQVYKSIKYDIAGFNIELPDQITYGDNRINTPIIDIDNNVDWSDEELEYGDRCENLTILSPTTSSGSPLVLTVIDNYKIDWNSSRTTDDILTQLRIPELLLFNLNFSLPLPLDYTNMKGTNITYSLELSELQDLIPSYSKHIANFLENKTHLITNSTSYISNVFKDKTYTIDPEENLYIIVGLVSTETVNKGDNLVQLEVKDIVDNNIKDFELYNHSYDFLQKGKILQDFTLCFDVDLDETFEQNGLTLELLYKHNSTDKYPLIYAYDCIYDDKTQTYSYPSPDIKNPIIQTSEDLTNGCNITNITVEKKQDSVNIDKYNKNFIIYSSGITDKFTHYIFSIKPKNMNSTITGGIKEKINGLDNDRTLIHDDTYANKNKIILYPWTNFETSKENISIKMSSSKKIRIYLYLKRDDYIILYKAQKSYLELNSFDIEQMLYLSAAHLRRRYYIKNKNKTIESLDNIKDNTPSEEWYGFPSFINEFKNPIHPNYINNLFINEHSYWHGDPIFYYITDKENVALSYPVSSNNIYTQAKDAYHDEIAPYFTAHSRGLNNAHNYFIIPIDYNDRKTYKLQFSNTYNKIGYPSQYTNIKPIEAINTNETKVARNILEFINPCPSVLNNKLWLFECWIYFQVNNDTDDNYYDLLQIGNFPNANDTMGYLSLTVQPSTGQLQLNLYEKNQICSKLLNVSNSNKTKKILSNPEYFINKLNNSFKLQLNAWNHIAFYDIFLNNTMGTAQTPNLIRSDDFNSGIIISDDTRKEAYLSDRIDYFTGKYYNTIGDYFYNGLVFSLNGNLHSNFNILKKQDSVSNLHVGAFNCFINHIHNILFFMRNDVSPFKLLLTGVNFEYDNRTNTIPQFNLEKIK